MIKDKKKYVFLFFQSSREEVQAFNLYDIKLYMNSILLDKNILS